MPTHANPTNDQRKAFGEVRLRRFAAVQIDWRCKLDLGAAAKLERPLTHDLRTNGFITPSGLERAIQALVAGSSGRHPPRTSIAPAWS